MQLNSQQEIRILHIDDEPSITDLTATFLEREDDQLSVETATSADEGLKTLSDRPPDCIVSDYNMPGMDGLEFLQAIREDYPDLPFILFTGKGSEEVASDAISAGVTDYLQKGSGTERYELLANRIRNAVEARRETKRADRQQQLMRLTEFAGDTGGFELDVDSGDLLLTDGTRRLVGLSEGAHLSLEEAIELYHPDDQADIREIINRVAETGEQTRATWRLQTPGNDERLVDVTITPATESDDVTTLWGAVHDVTERRKRQQELEQVETWFQYAQTGLVLLDVGEEFTVERVNPMWEETTGLAAEQVYGRTLQDVLGEQAGAMAREKTRECVQQREPVQFEENIQFDGERATWLTHIAPVVVNETVEYVVGETRDVTAQRERQQELQRLQQAIDGANVPITLADPSQEDNPLVYVNDAFEDMTGYPPEDALGRNCRFLQGEDTDPEKVTALRDAIEDAEPISLKLRNYRKDGTEFWNHLTLTPIYADSGELVRYLGTQQDISERKERERELRAERQFIEQALDTLDDLFYVLDTDGTLRRWNKRTREITSYTDRDLADMQVIELFPEDERETIAGAIETTLADGQATVEADLRTADGDRCPYELTGARLTDEDGTVTGLVGVGRDLSERRQRERRFQALVEESNDIISILDADGVFEYQSPSVERILGYAPGETIGDPAWEYVHPDDRDTVMDTFEEWVSNPEMTATVEYRAQHADGSWRWMEAQSNNQLDNPAVEGYVVNSWDITDRRERQEELQDIKSQYQTLAENFPDGAVFLYDRGLRVVRAGGSELSEAGLSLEEIEGSTPHTRYPPEIAEELVRNIENALAGESNRFEQEYQGEHYRIQTAPVRAGDGEITYAMAVSQNITDQVADRQELEHQNEWLEEFTSVVSHDLRNPLNVAQARVTVLQDRCCDDESQEHLDKTVTALERMENIIEDTLALARQGDTVAEMTPIQITSLVDQCWEGVETAGATLEITDEFTLRGDRERLRHIFENLFSNAVEHGGDDVAVRVGRAGEGRFYVEDNGPGIPPSDRKTVFEAGHTSATGGTGFGLTIVKRIAEAHGWRVSITDSRDGGARFEFDTVEVISE